MVFARVWGWGRARRYYLMGLKFQFCKMKEVLEMNGCDGCTAMWMYLIPLNYVVKIVNLLYLFYHNFKN